MLRGDQCEGFHCILKFKYWRKYEFLQNSYLEGWFKILYSKFWLTLKNEQNDKKYCKYCNYKWNEQIEAEVKRVFHGWELNEMPFKYSKKLLCSVRWIWWDVRRHQKQKKICHTNFAMHSHVAGRIVSSHFNCFRWFMVINWWFIHYPNTWDNAFW
mgnify:CR=1 FL=1